MTQEPVVWDAGLQPERTALAWHRLGLAIAALALILTKVIWPVLGAFALLPTSTVLILAISVAVLGRRRYAHHNHALRTGRGHLPDGRLPVLVVVTTTLIALSGALLTL